MKVRPSCSLNLATMLEVTVIALIKEILTQPNEHGRVTLHGQGVLSSSQTSSQVGAATFETFSELGIILFAPCDRVLTEYHHEPDLFVGATEGGQLLDLLNVDLNSRASA